MTDLKLPKVADACPCLDPCPADAVLSYIGGKWKLKLICTLYFGGTMRYGELKRAVAGISPTMLAGTLKELEGEGLVSRTVTDESPVRVDYCLTEAGMTLVPILKDLRQWAINYRPESYSEIDLD